MRNIIKPRGGLCRKKSAHDNPPRSVLQLSKWVLKLCRQRWGCLVCLRLRKVRTICSVMPSRSVSLLCLARRTVRSLNILLIVGGDNRGGISSCRHIGKFVSERGEPPATPLQEHGTTTSSISIPYFLVCRRHGGKALACQLIVDVKVCRPKPPTTIHLLAWHIPTSTARMLYSLRMRYSHFDKIGVGACSKTIVPMTTSRHKVR